MNFLDEIAAGAADRPAPPERPHRDAGERGGLFYGPGLIAGELQFWSVSSLQLGDPESAGGCPRRWWYDKIGGKKQPDHGWANEVGTQLHRENEHYLRTGDKSQLGPLAYAGVHMLPAPGPDLLLEHEIATAGESSLRKVDGVWSGSRNLSSLLTCCGLPVVGKIDLVHRRGTNAGTTEILEATDPPGTAEVHDHKTTSDLKWAKTGDQLPDTIQMAGYGIWVNRHFAGEPELVRLSHGYYVTKGRPRAEKRTTLVPVERLLRRWEYVEGRGRVLVDASRETDASRVEYNVGACAFPRRKKVDIDAGIPDGCPHQAYCDGARQHNLMMLYGAPPTEGDGDMGLLDDLLQDDAPLDTPTAQPTGPDADPDVVAALAFIREAGKAPRTQAPEGYGFPALAGEPAQVQAMVSGAALEGSGLAGAGKLGKLTISTRADLFKLAAELGWVPASPAPADQRPAPDLAPPEAPAPGTVAPPPPKPKKDRATKKAPPDAVGARAGGDAPHTLADAAAAVAPSTVDVLGGPPPAGAPEVGRLFMIDCHTNVPHTDLAPWVQGIADRLARTAGVLDIRMNSDDRNSPLAFGGWRGALHTCVVAEASGIPAGTHVLSTAGSDFNEIAAAAIAAMPGVAVVRGRP